MAAPKTYSAKDIEVLEGLEPVRKRPGMYIGGTDERAMHHLIAEVLDNAMDEAVAGHATLIEMELLVDGSVIVKDNGRGIPVDPHPKFPQKSALEVIMTTLHSGGKFSGQAYETAGGLHGVGVSVVNALSEEMTIEVARDGILWQQQFSRGLPKTKLMKVGKTAERGTTALFKPDPQIFGPKVRFKPVLAYRMARAKAFLFKGVKILWKCDPLLITEDMGIPAEAIIHFPNGLKDFLEEAMKDRPLVTKTLFVGQANFTENMGRIEWAVGFAQDQEEGFFSSYCNTIPTAEGGTHESGFRTALMRSLRSYADMTGYKKISAVTAEDLFSSAGVIISVFIKDPQFQGQTKEKLVSMNATRLVDVAVKDHFDHWLTADTASANALLEFIIERAEARQRSKQEKELSRKSATKRLRLPGKLADCTKNSAEGTEIFIVEGDSAGGSAKQARTRETQAILPLRGKILNVASSSVEKFAANQELRDLIEALGCGIGNEYDEGRLRYGKVIIMTDADVDGAHIASLLMTFFYQHMPKLIENGRLYLALPPLYRLVQGSKSVYAMDDAEKEKLINTTFSRGKVEVSRFKGLGEMPPAQLKETTMSPEKRTLLRVVISKGHSEEAHEDSKQTASLVEQLMGKKPELRFKFIQEHAKFVQDLDL